MILILAVLVIGSIMCLFGTFCMAALWHFLRPIFPKIDAALAADLLFLMELGGLATAIASVSLFVLPGFMAWEPGESVESAPIWLVISAMLIAGVITRTIFNLVNDLRTMSFKRTSQPMVAVQGIFKPQLICTDSARALLNEEELDSVLRHEQAHVERRDNLRELLAKFSSHLRPQLQDFHDMRHMRMRLTECAADAAAASDELTALNLASALVRLARNMPSSVADDHFCVSTVVPDASTSVVADRVERLLHFSDLHKTDCSRWAVLAFLTFGLVFLLTLASRTEVQSVCYQTFERLVSL